MKRIVVAIILFSLSFVALAADRGLRVVHQEFNFYAPKNPEAVGILGKNNNTLFVKYSRDPGKKFIGFGFEHESESETGGCEPEVYFEEVLSKKEETSCDRLSIDTFRHVFVKDRDAGVWSGNSYKFFYFIGPKKSTVFFVPDKANSKIFKIDSNFLKKEQFKELLSEYL